MAHSAGTTSRPGRVRRSRSRWTGGLLAAVAIVVAACSSSAATVGPTPTTAPATAAVATPTAAATSAAPTQPSAPVNLSFWGWVPNEEQVVATWNAANPNIQVSFHRMTGDDGSKIPAAIDAGTAPDIIQMGSADVPSYVINNRLADISSYLTDVKSDYDATAWSAVSFGNAIYAVPQDAGPSGMVYRADIFTKYNIPVPTTWAQYLDAGLKLKAADPNIYLAQLSANEPGFWLQDAWQAGGSFYGTSGNAWTVNVNGPESKNVAALWQQAFNAKLFKVVDMWTPAYWTEINAGHIATINYLAWFPGLLESNAPKLSGDWKVAPSPTFPGMDTAGAGGYGVNAVPRGTKNIAQAVQFMKWLDTSNDGLDFLISKGGLFPAAIPGLARPSLLSPDAYFGGQSINEVFVAAAKKVPATWTNGPTLSLTLDAFKDNFAKVATGQLTFSQALDLVAEKERQDLLDAGLNVK